MTTPLDRLVAATLADPLDAARRHAAGAGRVIGYWSANVPVELLLATGAFPLHLPPASDTSTPLADRYLEPLFDRGLRTAFERWLAGDFDFLDSIVLPRSLDSAQRIYYYAEELRRTGLLRGPRVHLYDLQTIPRASSVGFTRRRTRELADALGVASTAVAAGIACMNRRRELLDRLAGRQRDGRVPDPGFLARVLRAALYAPFDGFDAALDRWLADLPGIHACARRGLVLAGSVPPDESIHDAVATGGGFVVLEQHLACAQRHGPPVPEGRPDLVAAIADVYQRDVPSMRRFGAHLDDAVAAATRHGASGLLLWLTEEDEAYAWQVPALLKRATDVGLPVLALTRQPWRLSLAASRRIEAFVAGEMPR